jgi:hypothetical protein
MSESELALVTRPLGNAAGEIGRLENEIARRRQRVAASFSELHERVNDAFSWRHWVRSHLPLSIATGLSLGFFIGYRERNHR